MGGRMAWLMCVVMAWACGAALLVLLDLWICVCSGVHAGWVGAAVWVVGEGCACLRLLGDDVLAWCVVIEWLVMDCAVPC